MRQTPLWTRRAALWSAICTLGTSAGFGAWAQTLAAPSGPVILTISGKIGLRNAPDGARFDRAMLERLPQQRMQTRTPWDKEPVQFAGPLLRDVLAAVQAQGTTLHALALNDYKTRIPVADTQQFDVLLAHSINGQPIPVRTKGPLFIIYPFDAKPELQAVTYYERSAWQLKSLAVE
ncbi:MAG: oxidoreductase [Rhodoferax sp.]